MIAALVFAACSSGSGSKSVDNICKKMVQDPAFKEFCLTSYDSNKDGKVSMEEAAAVERMEISGLGIQSLAGIEYFTGLKYLDCSNNELKTLSTAGLGSLQTLVCNNNLELVSLNVSGSPELFFLYAGFTSITSLDLSAQHSLVKCWLGNTALSALDLSACPKIADIEVNSCLALKSLRLSPEVNTDNIRILKSSKLEIEQ